MFLMIDGIDGSGKGTIVSCLREALQEAGKNVADLPAIMKQGRFPEEKDWRDADVVVTTEPTYAGVGAVLRTELLRDASYDPGTVAAAFSVDREMHYRRVIIPACAAKKCIISERGISSSLAYQVTAGLPEADVLAFAGNALAMEHAPDFLVLADIDPETAIARLAARAGKQDDSYFERAPFLRTLAARYRDPAYRTLFETRGTTLIDLSTAGTIEETRERCKKTLLSLILS
jgi:dTMP kinase